MRTIIALAALLPPLLGSAADAAPAFTIAVRPPVLRLAEGGRATVRIATTGEPPVVTANFGRVERLREVGSGLFEAEYVPPDTLDPHVVLISAVSSAGFAWTALSLAGVREVETKAPHRALVSVMVQDQAYGPIPADASGRAVLRVDVPPGVHVATSNGRTVNLDVPRTGFAHVALEYSTLEANVAKPVTVRVIAVDDRGERIAKPQVKLTATEGKLSQPRQSSPGVVEATWTVGAGGLRDSRVTAQVTSRPGASASAVLRRVAGEPAAVKVEVDRERLVAGEGDELIVKARAVDAAGNTTDVPTRLFVSIGAGASARMLPDAVMEWEPMAGVYTGRVAVPRQRAGQVLELKVVGPNSLVGTRTVELVPGPAAVVKVEPEEQLLADGRSRQLRVVLLDQQGNRAQANVAPQVTATHGQLGTPTRSGSGVYLVDYRSPLSATDYRDLIRARVGPLEGQTELRVRARGGTVVLGVKGGYAVGTGSLSAPAGGVEIGFWRASFSTSVGLVLDLRYFSFGRDETLTAGTTSLPVSSDASFLAIEPSIAWRRPLVRGMLWLGAGPGIVRTSTTVSAPGQEDLTASSWVPSAHASVGWGLPLGPGIPFAEVKGAWQAEAGKGAVSGSVTTLNVNLGYRFDVL